ncbi:MAG TPA: serine/threonine-protein kinase, partial [Urbifossiella sp.]|nr:serine/threonine-protein kinase [Urbifossiella sp.]
DEAKANRVLIPEQVELLIRQPDIPQTNLTALCEYLESRGALTKFQAAALRGGRGGDLSFAGYPVLEEIGPCPGGTAYRALHPSLRTPVVLRKYRADALLPADNPAALVLRARTFPAFHPNLLVPLDAGEFRGEHYAAVEEPADTATLEQLVKEIGPMPVFLAAEFGRQAASALRSVDERGLWHGDIRPATLLAGPMTVKTAADGTVKRRPAPNAAVKVTELGLVPIRPPATVSPPALDALPFLPPERVDGAAYDARGDLYGLGASLYYLLTGKPPFAGAHSDELLAKVRTVAPLPLATLRPDLPPGFVAVVERLMAKRPEHRPQRAAEAEAALVPFCRPGTAPPPPPAAAPVPMPHPVPVAVPVPAAPVPDAAAVADPQPSAAEEWGATDHFNTSHAAEGPIYKARTPEQKGRTRMLVVLGLCLHLSAMALLGAWLFGLFERSPEPEPAPQPKKENKKQNRKA